LLGADRVHARRRGSELKLVRLDDRARARALDVASALLSAVSAQVGGPRDEVESAVRDVTASFDLGPSDRRVIDGLWKLLDDAIQWDGGSTELDPVDVRREVFELASARRRDGEFDREAVLAEIATLHSAEPAAIERALYSDLRQAQRLIEPPPWSAQTLVSAWENAQAQAVLLRAVKIEVWVSCNSAGAYRALFHRLKFLRLLHEVHRAENWPNGRQGGHRIVIDGPFSMFESVTKYGLKLAMIMPVLESADAFHLVAEVRWGNDRKPLTFRLDGGCARGAEPPPLSDDVSALLDRFRALESEWKVAPAPDVLELPGIGLCVPDLVFKHRDGTKVFLEVLGFWSREAVFRRIELVERGMKHKILFAVSKRLRVREDLLDDGLPGALYVYKGTMSARVVLERLEALRGP
jgi:uncharacterized protein